MEAFDRIRGESPVSAAGSWPHPFAHWTDEPHRTPPALVARLRASVGTDDPLRVATVSAVHRVLDHAGVPHVLPIRAVERDVDGRLVLAYRRVAGTDLATVLKRGPLTKARAFAILHQVCRALAAAHVVGIDHRVLGPASVLLEPQGDELDRVWISDFGIAQLFDADEDTSALELHPTTPERVFGGASETSEDVYLVGCLAYWLFTGAPPFVADDLATLQRRHAIEDPKRLSELALAGIPAGLDEVIARALEKDPDERWADVEELEAEIARIQDDRGVPLRALRLEEPRRHTMILRPTAVLPTITAPSEAPRGKPAALPGPARRRSMPLVLTSIGFSIGLFALGFVDPPPERSEVNHLAPARAAVGAPAPVEAPEPAAVPERVAEPELAVASAIVVEPAPMTEPTAEAPPDLPPVPGPVPPPVVRSEPLLAKTVPPRVTDDVPVRAPRAHDDAERQRACQLARKKAGDARATHDWAGVLRQTDARACWPSEHARVKLRVKALLELHRFSDCVEVAPDADGDAELARWVALCRKRLEITL